MGCCKQRPPLTFEETRLSDDERRSKTQSASQKQKKKSTESGIKLHLELHPMDGSPEEKNQSPAEHTEPEVSLHDCGTYVWKS